MYKEESYHFRYVPISQSCTASISKVQYCAKDQNSSFQTRQTCDWAHMKFASTLVLQHITYRLCIALRKTVHLWKKVERSSGIREYSHSNIRESHRPNVWLRIWTFEFEIRRTFANVRISESQPYYNFIVVQLNSLNGSLHPCCMFLWRRPKETSFLAPWKKSSSLSAKNNCVFAWLRK